MALTWLAILAIIIVQALPFTYGYRLSADEVAFLAAAFDGWGSVKELTTSLAVDQGRLGLLGTTPLNVLGAYLADDYLARWSFVLLHFAVLALFAAYFSLISASNVTRALLIFLIALQPIGRNHHYMPPISYPLQNTLPFLALLAARWTIFRVQQHEGAGDYLLWPARIVFLLAIMTTEYAFLLATALLAAEYGFALARSRRRGASSVQALLGTFGRSTFLYDASIVVFALAAYLLFRRLYPSGYPGNVIDAGLEVGRVVETTAGHVLAGTIFSHGFFDIGSLPRDALPMAVLAGILTAACLFAVLYDVRDLPSPLVISSASVLAIAYVTFPLSGNARQQAWCLESGNCGWLDSRISYLGVAVIIICVIALVLRHMPTYKAAMLAVAMISGATGVVAAMTYARNFRDSLATADAAKPWERAALLACHPEVEPAADLPLLRLIDPERLIRFHPGTDAATYWRHYMKFLRADRACPNDVAGRQAILRQLDELGPALSVGSTVHFNNKSASRYLGIGWSQQERWGVWSEGARASLVFLPRISTGADALWLHVVFRPYVPPSVGRQTIAVTVNGRPVDTWTIGRDMDTKECCERTIPLGRVMNSSDEIDVTFHIHNPRNPDADRKIVEGRRLGLFLQSMTLADSADKGR